MKARLGITLSFVLAHLNVSATRYFMEDIVSTSSTKRSQVLILAAATIAIGGAIGIFKLLPHHDADKPGGLSASQGEPANKKEPGENQSGLPKNSSVPQKNAKGENLSGPTPPSPLAPIPGKTYPMRNLNAEFASLSEKAQSGDSMAARTLSNALQLCANVPKTFDELDSATANANRQNLAPNWAALLQYDLEYKKSLYNQCEGTTSAEVGTRAKWLGLLAQSGDSDARLQYVAGARPTDIAAADFDQQLSQYKQNAAQYIQSEIDSGNPKGLLTMGLQYYDSPIQFEGIVPLYSADNVKAYSYFYAYGLADPSSQSAVSILANLQNQLSPSQLQEAMSNGTNLYNNCCKRKN